MSKYNVSSLVVIRDRALNLASDIRQATVEFGSIRSDLAQEDVNVNRISGESDTTFLNRLATDLTILIQKEQNKAELESIMEETALPDPEAQPTMNLRRRPVTKVGRLFNKAASFFG